ncbi:hypothetical protein K0U83_20355 [bacterium]|nr:hypothetical protein [bacterium]
MAASKTKSKNGRKKARSPAQIKAAKANIKKARAARAKRARTAKRIKSTYGASSGFSGSRSTRIRLKNKKKRPSRHATLEVSLLRNPAATVVAGVDMLPVAVGAVGAVAVNQLFNRVGFLKTNVVDKLPAGIGAAAPSVLAIGGGVVLHFLGKRMQNKFGDMLVQYSGFIAAAGLVLGLSKATEDLLQKHYPMSGMYQSYSGAHDMGGAYGMVNGAHMNGAYLMTDDSGMSGAYVQTPSMKGVAGGAGAFGGITNFA